MTNQTKHTPGPWHEGAGNGEGSIFADKGRMRMTDKGTTLWPICRMFTDWNEAEDQANARLIAAAPDLLAALEELTGCAGLTWLDGFKDELDAAMTQAHAAIKQVKGEIALELPRTQAEIEFLRDKHRNSPRAGTWFPWCTDAYKPDFCERKVAELKAEGLYDDAEVRRSFYIWVKYAAPYTEVDYLINRPVFRLKVQTDESKARVRDAFEAD